jgi:hypothetical protein
MPPSGEAVGERHATTLSARLLASSCAFAVIFEESLLPKSLDFILPYKFFCFLAPLLNNSSSGSSSFMSLNSSSMTFSGLAEDIFVSEKTVVSEPFNTLAWAGGGPRERSGRADDRECQHPQSEFVHAAALGSGDNDYTGSKRPGGS